MMYVLHFNTAVFVDNSRNLINLRLVLFVKVSRPLSPFLNMLICEMLHWRFWVCLQILAPLFVLSLIIATLFRISLDEIKYIYRGFFFFFNHFLFLVKINYLTFYLIV